MTKQINKSWRSSVLTTVAIFVLFSASGAVFAQKNDKYPKPDFKEMEEYFEIVEHEYEFTGLGSFTLSPNRNKSRCRDGGQLLGVMRKE